MTESAWKVVMDRDGITISGDTFSLTTNGSDPLSLDTAVSELQMVSRGTYGQYCGLSRAVEAVGERWGMHIVRDLLVAPKTVAELHQGLPRVSKNVLAMRLRELAYIGIIEKSGTVGAEDQYQLTAYGRELEEILLALGRWGSAMLAQPRPEDIVTEDSMMVALRAMFLREASAGRSARFQLHLGDVVVHAVIDDGKLEVGRGPIEGAQVIDPGPTLKDLMTRTITVPEAMATGMVNCDQDALASFVSMFALPKLTVPQPAAA
jgi:DNA-binding HxlR family transcriptional regulator